MFLHSVDVRARATFAVAALTAAVVAAMIIAPLPVAAGELILPHEMSYLGAFRLGGDNDGGSEWGSGGGGLTYIPSGDPGGPNDGFPGSLMGLGKHPVASEVSIPVPALLEPDSDGEYDGRALPRGVVLQPWADLTGGLRSSIGVDKLSGLAYLPRQAGQTSDKIYWTVTKYYNASGTNYLSHGMSELDLSSPASQGGWRLGSVEDDLFHCVKTADYIFDVPQDFADEHLGGKRLVSGRHRSNGAFGGAQGPSLYAFAPWQDPSNEMGSEIDATALMMYPTGGDYFPDYCPDDKWTGGVWLTAGSRSAVLIVGSKGMGENYYGEGAGDACDQSKGFHCDPYEPQFLFYNPADLAAVAAGEREPWQVLPFASISPSVMWPKCRITPKSVAFDRDRGILYVLQYNGTRIPADYGSRYPIVHAWKIQAALRPGAEHADSERERDDTIREDLGESAASRVGTGLPALPAVLSDPMDILVSPNPFHGVTEVSLARKVGSGIVHAAVYDLSGRQVKDLGQLTSNPIQWNASDLATGVYFVRVTSRSGSVTRKVSLVR